MKIGVHHNAFATEGVRIRGVGHAYARHSGEPVDLAMTPKDIEDIALDLSEGDRAAARAAYMEFGTIIGEALANVMTLFDSLVVIGGGLAKARSLFMKPVLKIMNGKISRSNGEAVQRLAHRTYDLDDAVQREVFLTPELRQLTIPGTPRTVPYDEIKRIGLGMSRRGTKRAVSLGAYAYAVQAIDG